MKIIPPRPRAWFAALAIIVAPHFAAASTTLFSIPTGQDFFETHGNGMVGYTFSVKRPVTVVSVGWYDHGGDGLSRNYQVGLWKAETGGFGIGQPVQAILSNSGITIPAASTLQGLWRVTELAVPIVLQPGYYQIAGLDTASSTDPIRYIFQVGNEYENPDVSLGAFFYTAQTQNQAPGFRVTSSDYFYLASGFELGPMLFTVPEPGVCCIGAMGALVLLRRRRS